MKSFDSKRLPVGLEESTESATSRPPAAPAALAPGRPLVGGLSSPPLAQAANRTGLPDELKAGVEELSGMSLDDVTVHYDSALPAQVGAHAFTQGQDIYVGPGQETHLPHEAWHVVQQKQGRVRPTMQLKTMPLTGSRPVNDDQGLEREADVMGARALRSTRSRPGPLTRAHLAATPSPTGVPAIQMVKIVATTTRKSVTITAHPDDYKLRNRQRLATEQQILDYRGDDAEILGRQQEINTRIAQERSAARKQRRAERRATETPKRLPKGHAGKQIDFPVVLQEGGAVATLVYRGMSVNNINNLQKAKDAIFTAQTPTGEATPVEHIVDDSETSPYLSFEQGGLGISAGKYAAKPVDAQNRPLGVTVKEGTGFLKQEKSYTAESQQEHAGGKRLGYVGGIPSAPDHLDVSDNAKATRELKPPGLSEGAALKSDKAIKLAEADREILVKPGVSGIGPDGVPFVAKVKVVDDAYFRKNLIHQTPTKALGFFKPFGLGDAAVFSKIQVVKGSFTFNIPPELLHFEEDSEGEMSENEDMNLEAYD